MLKVSQDVCRPFKDDFKRLQLFIWETLITPVFHHSSPAIPTHSLTSFSSLLSLFCTSTLHAIHSSIRSQPVFPPSEWRSLASRRTCSGCWSVACSLLTWRSMLGTLGRSWAGRTRPCCVPSVHTSDSCFWGPKPGRGRQKELLYVTAW